MHSDTRGWGRDHDDFMDGRISAEECRQRNAARYRENARIPVIDVIPHPDCLSGRGTTARRDGRNMAYLWFASSLVLAIGSCVMFGLFLSSGFIGTASCWAVIWISQVCSCACSMGVLGWDGWLPLRSSGAGPRIPEVIM